MIRNLVAPLGLGLLFLGGWEVISRRNERVDFFASKPSEFAQTWFNEIANTSYWTDVIATTWVLALGYLTAAIVGYGLGVLVYWLKSRALNFEGWLLVLGSVPIFALAPILILAFGSGPPVRVAVVTLSSVFLIASGVFQACRTADEQFGSIARDLGTSKNILWQKILFPGGLIYAIPSLKGAVALSLIGVFVAEWISSTEGLGKYILSAMSLYDAPRLIVGILTFMSISAALMIVISLIEERTTSWRNFR
jgi:NitT/TauT family transport system permease protein